MRTIDTAVRVGAHVQFDSDHGTQLGKVAEIKSDVSNGRRVAAVQVPGAMNGQPWLVPVDELKPSSQAR